MTSPLHIDPGVVHNHANGQRADADRFFDAPPPTDPGDDPDDPTKSATRDFNNSVKTSRDHLRARSQRHADAMDATATVLQAQDEENAQNIQAISPKDQAGIFTGLVKDLTSTLTGATQSLSAAAFAAVASTAQAGGTLLNTGMSAAQTAGKMAPDHAGVQAGVATGGGAPVAAGGDSKEDDKRAQTRPASAASSFSTSPSNRGSFWAHGDYANTDHDRETGVQPASMAMPGGAAGLGGLGGASGAPTGKITTHKVVASEQPVSLTRSNKQDDESDDQPAVYAISGVHVVAPRDIKKDDV